MRKNLFQLLVLCFVSLLFTEVTYSQTCPDPAPQTSGTHIFRREGEIIDIPVQAGDCQAIALELRWANGRNNGCIFRVTLLDTNHQPIYVKQFSGFQTGKFEFPFNTFGPRPWLGSSHMLSVPSSVTVEAVRPLGLPAGLSYTVTRVASPTRRSHPPLGHQMAGTLRLAAGRVLSKGTSSVQGSEGTINYRLEEVRLNEPRTLEIRGNTETLDFVFRLIVTGGDELGVTKLIWLDDAPLPVFRRHDGDGDADEIGAIIYDRSILRREVEISVSDIDGSHLATLTEPLTLPADFRESKRITKEENGNMLTRIHSAVRAIGASKQTLIQIELKTNRPVPPNGSPLKLQVGKRFFVNELSGDHTGRSLTLTLTAEMFASLKQGAEIVAFFDKPDLSGFADQNIWRFGRLNKEMLEEVIGK
ncbi:MAG TPA: hypothetical protein VJM12_12835 [Pyrinomonadaceae bacterium]|nr:hypothetical protein [Pyrinomonadaceae bacterium]